MNIVLYSSKRERCGISTYTDYLAAAMIAQGHNVEHMGSGVPHQQTVSAVRRLRPNVFHFQHEPSIMPPDAVAANFSKTFRLGRTKVALTLHTENPATVKASKKIVPSQMNILLHRPSVHLPGATLIPMACPTLDPVPEKAPLRTKYGFPQDAFIVSTVGFMIPWKEHPRIAEHLVSWLIQRPKVHLQIIASAHFNKDLNKYAAECQGAIARLASIVKGDRIRHIDTYPSDFELLERLCMSDLGYTWCSFNTGSASAAAAVFTSARCPLVATDSSHYSHLGQGLIRGPKHHMGAFARLIQEVAENQDVMRKLKKSQVEQYLKANYGAIARQHVELYERMPL